MNECMLSQIVVAYVHIYKLTCIIAFISNKKANKCAFCLLVSSLYKQDKGEPYRQKSSIYKMKLLFSQSLLFTICIAESNWV